MDLTTVKKSLPIILMNCDNQAVIIKVDSLNALSGGGCWNYWAWHIENSQ
jgi:hypothetical protein